MWHKRYAKFDKTVIIDNDYTRLGITCEKSKQLYS